MLPISWLDQRTLSTTAHVLLMWTVLLPFNVVMWNGIKTYHNINDMNKSTVRFLCFNALRWRGFLCEPVITSLLHVLFYVQNAISFTSADICRKHWTGAQWSKTGIPSAEMSTCDVDESVCEVSDASHIMVGPTNTLNYSPCSLDVDCVVTF